MTAPTNITTPRKSAAVSGSDHRLVVAFLAAHDIGLAPVSEIVEGTGLSRKRVMAVIDAGDFAAEQQLGRDFGERWKWRMRYGLRRNKEPRMPDVWDDPKFRGHGFTRDNH